MIGEEKSLMKKRESKLKQKDILKSVKELNKERVSKGAQPYYLKKSQLKDLQLKEKFDKLDKEGRLESFLQKQQEFSDKKHRVKTKF